MRQDFARDDDESNCAVMQSPLLARTLAGNGCEEVTRFISGRNNAAMEGRGSDLTIVGNP